MKIALRLREILDCYNVGIGNMALGHLGLNGYYKAVGERPILNPYSFTDDTRGKITRNRWVLRPFFEETDKEIREAITREVMRNPEATHVPEADATRQGEWHRRYAAAIAQSFAVDGLLLLNRDELFRDNKNPIPSEVEIALYPLILDSPWRLKFASATPKAATPPGGD
jgi:hypothetical protein